MFDLSGKVALVTGASGGIGGAIAEALASKGAQIALTGTRMEALEAAKTRIGGGEIFQCNLSDDGAPQNLVKAVEEKMGSLDILVSNAGLTRDGLLLRMKEEDWQNVLDVNLSAYFRLSKACLRGMMKRRHGRIIGITSVVGATGNAGQANYAASKAGMIGFTKSLAQEVASRGITANCIAPGYIATAMTEDLAEAQKEKLMDAIPAGRMGEGHDIAAAVVYLASDEASYVTGETLHVNGGMAML